mgnify:CR=1 FL=1
MISISLIFSSLVSLESRFKFLINRNDAIGRTIKTVIEKISKMGGDGGVIAIDNQGNIAMEMNTSGMYRAHINSKGEIDVKIYK